MLLTCLPKSICSWDYRVLGTSGAQAEVLFGIVTKPGKILVGDQDLAARKHGLCGGRWTLESGGKVKVEARQPRLLRRLYVLNTTEGEYTLRATSAFRSSYDLLRGETTVGRIWPAHVFTKRAYVDCDAAVPITTQLFAFWLAALTWRDAANAVAGS